MANERGFNSMDDEKQKEAARKGGKASHKTPTTKPSRTSQSTKNNQKQSR